MTDRENYLRTASLTGGAWIPCSVHISGASWIMLREEAEEVLAHHPTLFPNFEKGRHDYEHWQHGPACRRGMLRTHNWGSDNLWDTRG